MSARAKPKHQVRYEVKLPQHAESLNVYFVTDCACGWVSPLCRSEARAHELFEAHRKPKRRRDRA